MASSPRSPATTLASPSLERSVASVRTVVGASPAVTLASSPGGTVPAQAAAAMPGLGGARS